MMKASYVSEKITEIKESYSEKTSQLIKSLEDLSSVDTQLLNLSTEVNQFVDTQIAQANEISSEGGGLEEVVNLLANSLVHLRDHVSSIPGRIQTTTQNFEVQLQTIVEFQENLTSLENSVNAKEKQLDSLKEKIKSGEPTHRRHHGVRPEKIKDVREAKKELKQQGLDEDYNLEADK